MLSFNILGLFQLKGGHCVSHQKSNTNFLTHHAHYNVNVWCTRSIIAADLCTYITSTTPLLPNGTVVFAVCTAQSTVTGDLPHAFLNLDSLTFVIIPGDPNSNGYDVRFFCLYLFFRSSTFEGPFTG
jgi:hypothetical protein